MLRDIPDCAFITGGKPYIQKWAQRHRLGMQQIEEMSNKASFFVGKHLFGKNIILSWKFQTHTDMASSLSMCGRTEGEMSTKPDNNDYETEKMIGGAFR